MKLNVVGASGSGTTTLAAALAQRGPWTHLDADDFYWEPTTPAFVHKVAPELRRARLAAAFDAQPEVVVSGSLVSWGERWRGAFDLVVFLWIPPALRLERLRVRERARLGPEQLRDADTTARSDAFLAWAARYDDPDFDGRSRAVHEAWLKTLSCPVLRLEGDRTVQDSVQAVVRATSSG